MMPATSETHIEGLAALGQIVARERTRRSLSQQELADLAGVNRTTIVNVENPRRRRTLNAGSLLDVLGALGLHLTAVNEHRHDYEDVCKVCGQKRGAA